MHNSFMAATFYTNIHIHRLHTIPVTNVLSHRYWEYTIKCHGNVSARGVPREWKLMCIIFWLTAKEKPCFMFLTLRATESRPVWFMIPVFKSHINLKSYLTPFNECCVLYLCVRVSATSLNAFSQAMQLLTFPIVIINQKQKSLWMHRRWKSPHAGGLYCVSSKHQQKGAN